LGQLSTTAHVVPPLKLPDATSGGGEPENCATENEAADAATVMTQNLTILGTAKSNDLNFPVVHTRHLLNAVCGSI